MLGADSSIRFDPEPVSNETGSGTRPNWTLSRTRPKLDRIRNTASDKIKFSYGDPYQIRHNDYLNLCSGAGGAPVLHDPPERVHRLFYRREHPLAGRRLLQEWSRQVRNVVS